MVLGTSHSDSHVFALPIVDHLKDFGRFGRLGRLGTVMPGHIGEYRSLGESSARH